MFVTPVPLTESLCVFPQMLQERFREFARDTGNIGQERVDAVNQQADELINSGHADAATIAEWQDGLNEAWADLLELIDKIGRAHV